MTDRVFCTIKFTCIYAVAVKRCYENNRRTFLEQQSGKEDFVEQQSRRRKYRSRRERVKHTSLSYWLVVVITMCSFYLTEVSTTYFDCHQGRNGEVLEHIKPGLCYGRV